MKLMVIAVGAVLLVGSSAWAGTSCDSWSGVLFCDSFDTYCTNPDPTIGQCPRDGTSIGSDGQLHGVWRRTSTNYHLNPAELCGSLMTLEGTDSILTSNPYGARNPNGGDEHGSLGQSTVDLRPLIADKWGPQYNEVLGTDEAPLHLRFGMSGGLKLAGALSSSNGYLELANEQHDRARPGDYDPEVTPTDYVMVGVEETTGCASCYNMCPGPNYSVHVPWPTICQSYDARAVDPVCPPVPETKIHQTLAIGALALLDNDPCHCSTNSQKPTNYHLAFFDGWKWRILKSGVFQGSGDFLLGHKNDTVDLYVKSTTVDIHHFSRRWVIVPPATTYSWVTEDSYAYGVPRKYLGAFNVLRSGTSSGCKLVNDTYTCEQWAGTKCHVQGASRCDGLGYQDDGSRYVSWDDVVLTGGLQDTYYETGACCISPQGTCQEMLESDCQALGGRFSQADQSCANTVCCPTPFADADRDGDADVADFAAIQLCYTGTMTGMTGDCQCFDRNHDNRIDQTDIQSFVNCATGPEIIPSVVPAECQP